MARNFQGLFELPEALSVYMPEFEYVLTDVSAYSDEALKRTAELGVGLLLLKHIFRGDLRRQLPEIMKLWYTMHQQEHALWYLEAVIRYVASAGQNVSAEDVRAAIKAVAPEGDAMIGTIAQEWLQQGEQRGEQRGLRRGLLDGIELGLELRFGLEGLRLLPEITQIEDVGVLKAVHEAIRSVTRPEELRQFYAASEQ